MAARFLILLLLLHTTAALASPFAASTNTTNEVRHLEKRDQLFCYDGSDPSDTCYYCTFFEAWSAIDQFCTAHDGSVLDLSSPMDHNHGKISYSQNFTYNVEGPALIWAYPDVGILNVVINALFDDPACLTTGDFTITYDSCVQDLGYTILKCGGDATRKHGGRYLAGCIQNWVMVLPCDLDD